MNRSLKCAKKLRVVVKNKQRKAPTHAIALGYYLKSLDNTGNSHQVIIIKRWKLASRPS